MCFYAKIGRLYFPGNADELLHDFDVLIVIKTQYLARERPYIYITILYQVCHKKSKFISKTRSNKQ